MTCPWNDFLSRTSCLGTMMRVTDLMEAFLQFMVALDTPYSWHMYLAYVWGLTILDKLNLSALH